MDWKNIWKHPITTTLGSATWLMTLAYNCYEYWTLNKDTNKWIMAFGIANLVIGALSKD
jgi:hypothetical protein